jgi:hypothetical protein
MIALTCNQCPAADTVQGGHAAAAFILDHETQQPGHHVDAH